MNGPPQLKGIKILFLRAFSIWARGIHEVLIKLQTPRASGIGPITKRSRKPEREAMRWIELENEKRA